MLFDEKALYFPTNLFLVQWICRCCRCAK